MSARRDSAEQLARDIFRCEVVSSTLAGATTPCRKVVEWQGTHLSPRYCPEPWMGHLSVARILFLSSNPGADVREAQPDARHDLSSEDSDELLFRRFDNAFDPGQQPGIADGKYMVSRAGLRYGRAVRYWVWAKRIARELLGQEPRPGYDYALSEVVHCGTKREWGVREALPTCAERYLRRLIELSPASVVFVVGDRARVAVESLGPILGMPGLWGPGSFLGSERYLAAVHHPNMRGMRWGLDPVLGAEAAAALRSFASHA